MDNRLLSFARLAVAVARRALPVRLYARPAYRRSSLFAALLLKEHMRLNDRGLEDLLRISGCLRRLLGVLSVPDHSTFWWFSRCWLEPDLIAEALAACVRRRKPGRGRRPTLPRLP
jgi:Transposase domain (DUF772)